MKEIAPALLIGSFELSPRGWRSLRARAKERSWLAPPGTQTRRRRLTL